MEKAIRLLVAAGILMLLAGAIFGFLGQYRIIRQERFARDFLPNQGREPQPYFVYGKA